MQIIVNPGGVQPNACSLKDFFAANPDIDRDERLKITATLKLGETYFGGGGAAARWSVAPAKDVAA